MIAFRGALIVAGLCLVLPCLASAQAPPPSPPQKPLRADPAIDEAAREYVAETMPMNDARRALARDGQVQVPCEVTYPNTTTTSGSTIRTVPPNEQLLIRSAVDSAIIEHNLMAAGLPAGVARSFANIYRDGRLRFDTLPFELQKQQENSHQSPRWRLIGYLRMIDDQPQLPQFKDPVNCGGIALPMIRMTKFKFDLKPEGGSVWVIPYFVFRVCQKRATDPYSHTACDWIEIVDYTPLRGRYVYSAEWPQGPPRRRTTTFARWETDKEIIRLSQDAE